jgi:hypothetical protein
MKFLRDWFSAKQSVYIVKLLAQSTYKCRIRGVSCGTDGRHTHTERYTLIEICDVVQGTLLPKGIKLELRENLCGNYGLTRKVGEVYELADPLKRGWKVAP